MKRKVSRAFLIFPNSLGIDTRILNNFDVVFCIEDSYFWKPKNYEISKIKLAYFRATMKYFYDQLDIPKKYIEYTDLKDYEFAKDFSVSYMHTQDLELEEFLNNTLTVDQVVESSMFLLTMAEAKAFFNKDQKRYVQQSFFEMVKKKYNCLVGVPSLDHENRKSLPKNHHFTLKAPSFDDKDVDKYYSEAKTYIDSHNVFKNHIGSTKNIQMYPITPSQSKEHFIDFLRLKINNFGPFEDAIDKNQSILYHSFISAPLNIGLLCPKWAIATIMDKKDIPMNSLEGFVRQLMGWREYQRGIYFSFPKIHLENHFKNENKLEWKYWLGKEKMGIPILDNEIKKALDLGYCHHIPRLCIFLNIFNLLGVCLEDIVQWFFQVVCMDAYPWVMYSNIASMGYFDTRFMQKPYITASAYLLKMSNYEKGDWAETWNCLFYRFLHVNKSKLTSGASAYLRNLAYFQKKDVKEQTKILNRAQAFIDKVTNSNPTAIKDLK